MRVLLDSNILVRLCQPRHPYSSPTAATIARLIKAKHGLRLVPQVLYEFWAVATRDVAVNGLGMSVPETSLRIQEYSDTFPVLRDERGILELWRRLVEDHQVRGRPTHDARIAAAMLRHRITHLLTLNAADFRRYPGIKLIDPLSDSSPR